MAVVVLTWPLGAHLSTELPSTAGPLRVDQYYAGWALAWQAHALVTAPLHYADANIYWPATRTLFYGTPGLALLPTFAPIYLATGDVTTSLNLTVILHLALAAAALHWAAARLGRSTAAGIAAGATYLLSDHTLGWPEVAPQYLVLWSAPLVVTLVAEVPRTRAQTLLLAALLVLQCLGDAVYLGPPLLLVTAVGAVLALGPSPDTRAGIRRVAVAIALATIVVLPLYLEYVLVARANPDLHHQTVWGADEVYVNLGGVLPFSGPLALDRMIFVPILAGLALRTVGPPDRRNARAWICAGTFFVVTLVVSWTLPSVIPGLRGELESLGVRAPLRAGFVGRMGICLLVGLGLASCVRAAERVLPPALGRLAAVLLLVAVLASRWPYAPFALGEHPLYPAPMVGEEAELLRAGSGAVLVLPLGRRGRDQNGQAVAMYRATAHWRPLFNGYSSYYPAPGSSSGWSSCGACRTRRRSTR